MSKRTPENGENSALGFDYLGIITEVKKHLYENGFSPLDGVNEVIFKNKQVSTINIRFSKNNQIFSLAFFMKDGLFSVQLKKDDQELWFWQSDKLNSLKKNKAKRSKEIVKQVLGKID